MTSSSITCELSHEPSSVILAHGRSTNDNKETVGLAHGWFAVRPSGTADIYKLYAETFGSDAHLHAIVTEAREVVYQTLTQKRNGKGGLATEGRLVGCDPGGR